jgi:hypothetical protein
MSGTRTRASEMQRDVCSCITDLRLPDENQRDNAVSRAGTFRDRITDPVASFTTGGGYDQDRVYQAVEERHPDAAVIVPPRSTVALGASAVTARRSGTNPSRRLPDTAEWLAQIQRR